MGTAPPILQKKGKTDRTRMSLGVEQTELSALTFFVLITQCFFGLLPRGLLSLTLMEDKSDVDDKIATPLSYFFIEFFPPTYFKIALVCFPIKKE